MAAVLSSPGPPVAAQDEEPGIELGYPLQTRRPVIERELEFRVDFAKGTDGRLTRTAAAIEGPILPRWQVELEVPAVFREPNDEPATAGPGDVEIENKFLLWSSLEHRALVAAGFSVTLPTGSERRGLGGEANVEPFAVAAIAIGSFDLFASAGWEANFNAHVQGEQDQVLTTGVAAIYRWRRWFDPLLEVTTARLTRGEDASLRGRTQVYLLPGFNTRPFARTTIRAGIEVPLTSARQFDYAIHFGIVREF